MGVSLTDNTRNIEDNITQKANLFLRNMSEFVVNAAEPNTPKDTGRMRADVVKQVLGLKAKIIWGKNYAVYQETKQFRNYTTPGTGPHFAKNAIEQGKKNTSKIARSAGLI